MKKIISLILSVVMGLNITTAFSVNADASAETITVNHVVYHKVNDTVKNQSYYEVKNLFDTYEYSLVATEINIVDSIDGISVKSIGSYAYRIEDNNSDYEKVAQNVEKIILPDSIISIGENAFYNCFDKVTAIDLPKNLEMIDVASFQGMDNLKTVTIPEKITILNDRVFAFCTSLKDVKLGNNIKYISDMAFYGCKKLEKINLPASLKETYEETFSFTGFKTFTVPDGLQLGANNLSNCKRLEKVTFEGASNAKGVLNIYEFTFGYSKNLKTVLLPKNIKDIRIYNQAFINCKKLKKIYNSENITLIKSGAFKGCKSLTDFTVSSKVKIIPKNAFKGCKKLDKITIKGKKSPTIKKGAFKNIKSGARFYVKNRKVAKQLKAQLKDSGVKNVRIYVGKKLIFKNVK